MSAEHANTEGEATGRTLLEHHIRRYMGKATFDYFIHKDLGGFLRRELDWYIKHELLHLQDILDDGNTLEQLGRRHFAKLRVLRAVAEKLIAFLAQLENFQKKLWLKKKFVLETQYLVRVGIIPEEFYPDIAANEAQRKEWVALYAIDEIQKTDSGPGYSEPLTSAFVRSHPTLVVDTTHFDRVFVTRLLKALGAMDQLTDGLVFHSDNFHALNLMQAAYQRQFKCIYIDPPYNTSSSAIPYKNSYQHSSWCTLIRDRVFFARQLLRLDGAMFVSIDKTERTVLEHALHEVFGASNQIEELIWAQNTANSQLPNYSTNHEYVSVFARDRQSVEQDKGMFREPKPGFAEILELLTRLQPTYPPLKHVEEELQKLFAQHLLDYRDEIESAGREWDEDTKRQDPWRGIYPYAQAEYRDEQGRFVPESEARLAEATLCVWREISPAAPAGKQAASTREKSHHNFRFYRPSHPVTGKPCPHPRTGWKFPFLPDPTSPLRRSFQELDRDRRIVWGETEAKVPQTKGFLHDVETNIGTSVFYEYNDGEAELAEMFGTSGLFLSPKSSRFVRRFIAQATKPDSLVLDFFGGSGSTAHAVISQNSIDRGKRKFILAEMAVYIDTVLLPRIKKATYAAGWKNGRPNELTISDEALDCPRIVKVMRLESYEDACDNIHMERTKKQQEAFGTLPEAEREKYRLHYMLDIESRGSASLLNLDKFARPFEYTLRVTRDDVTRDQTVDLVETFNWLLGLKVETIRLSKDKSFKANEHGILEVTGEDPEGRRCLIVWRNTDEVDDDKLLKWFEANRHKVKDFEWDLIYVNGDNTLENLKRDDETWTVRLIEQEFHRLMFEGTE